MGTGTLVHSLGSMNLSPMIFELYNAMFRNSDVYINIVKIMSEHHSGITRSELSDAVGISGGTLTRILTNLERCDFIARTSNYGCKSKDMMYCLGKRRRMPVTVVHKLTWLLNGLTALSTCAR